MNGLECIRAAVACQPTDRLPFAPQLFGHAAASAGVALADYLRDGRRLADCQLRQRQRYGCDALFAFMDLAVETEAAGSHLEWRPGQYPEVVAYALTPGEIPAAIPDPGTDGRMPELLRAASLLRRSVGGTALVIGGLAGPMTLATQLLGIEAALYFAADDPRGFDAILDWAMETALRYGAAQAAAGAQGLMIFDPAASPAVVPAEFFRERLAPRLASLAAGLRRAGAEVLWLNIAGPTAPILPHYADIGVDIATFDYYLEAAEARRLLPRTCLAGNLKSLDFLEPAPEALAQQVAALAGALPGGGFILSSGCEIPPEAPAAGIAAVARAAGRESCPS